MSDKNTMMRVQKFLSMAGVCSRRKGGTDQCRQSIGKQEDG
ncbi:MAG: hypothetical protein R2874_15590 [Desulfobacterales bacterium]